jgi:prolyl oligopeptidase
MHNAASLKETLMFRRTLTAFIGFIAMTASLFATAQEDPNLWLEDVMGDKAIAWVKEQNAKTQKELEAHPQFGLIRDKVLEVVNSRERIPMVQKRGAYFYNFWQDAKNVRGIWRRTTLAEYKKVEPKWETVLDLDALAKDEKDNWVWRGSSCLFPDYNKCMVSLSRGGADAVVIREWDMATKSFVKDGFQLKEAKGSVAWIDANNLFVQTDFGAGSQTKSGYARIVKTWTRGTPIESAKTLYEGIADDISVGAFQVEQKGYATRQFLRRGVTFFTGETYLIEGSKLTKIDIPADANFSYFRDWMSVRLKSDWTVGGVTYKQGSLIAIPFANFMKGERKFDVLFEGSERKSLSGSTVTKNFIIINELDNVKNRLVELSLKNGKWQRRAVMMPGLGTVSVGAIDADTSDDYFMTLTDYLTPSTLMLAKAGTDKRERLKSLPAFFDATPYQVEQFTVASKDGEKIPYFVIKRKDIKLDGKNPTLLYGYGGFEVSQLPSYSGGMGNGWLAQGGVYVVANIRGGGEFGPRWHQAGLKANRQKVFDDFIAVAEDLILKKITAPRHLGISGGSNGGLLVGAVMVQRPDLFRAVLCTVPLLDMQRYHKLLAGASWVAEYGNPDDPKEWEYISKYSPYQNVKSGVKMPRVLFVTSTRDDRVHPGHARKMMAKMKEQGHDVAYYENIEGGHAGSANNQQLAYRTALQYAFLLGELK